MANRQPVALGDLEGVSTPDYGDPAKLISDDVSDEELLDRINNPTGLGHMISINMEDFAVEQGNHRIAAALARMAGGSEVLSPSTIIFALM